MKRRASARRFLRRQVTIWFSQSEGFEVSLKHWETYYRGGALVSCPTNTEPNYSKELREAWVSFFARLPDGARILDVGCGNGPVALIAKETATDLNRTFQIDAVDLAEIDPVRCVPNGETLFEGIRFHPGVSTENLPFNTSCMDAVCGQYIIEYTDVSRTLGEIARVSRPGGACQFILHHMDSIVVRNARESLRQANFALDEAKVVRLFRRYCEKLDQSPARAQSVRRALFDVGARMQNAAEASENPLFLQFVIDSINALLQHRGRISHGLLLRETNRLDHELKNWVRRLHDLVSGAQSEEDIAGIMSKAEELAFIAINSKTQVQDSDNLVGWRLNMFNQKAGRDRRRIDPI
jgi:ubiquinone/menaquinone biosynthesis C-methylase UbiE